MGERWQRFVAEVGRYLAVGLLATIVALVLFNLLVHGYGAFDAPMNDQPELAYLVANAVGMAISFRGTKAWAFRDREARHADGGVMAFVVINLVTLAIPMLCLTISRNVLGLDDPISDNVSANVVGLLLANAARFVLFRYYVFHRPPLPFHLRLTDAEVEDELRDTTGRSRSGRARRQAPSPAED
jgi:putative flippase GtrA